MNLKMKLGINNSIEYNKRFNSNGYGGFCDFCYRDIGGYACGNTTVKNPITGNENSKIVICYSCVAKIYKKINKK